MSSNQEGELLNELLNEQSYIQKLKLRATKQHRRIRDNMGEVFDGLMGSLRDRRRSLLATLTEITEELELQLTSIETAISSDVIRLQDLIQERAQDSEEVDTITDTNKDTVLSIQTNRQKRSLTKQAPEISFQVDPHLIAELRIAGCIHRSQSVLGESLRRTAVGLSHGVQDSVHLAPGLDNTFHILEAKRNLIHLVSHAGDLLHTVALHKTTRIYPVNQFYTHKDKFYVTSKHDGTLKIFFKNGQLEHSLSRVGCHLLSDPCGMGHTSRDQLVVANTAQHSLLLCQQDLCNAMSIVEHSYQPHTLLPSPKYLVVDENDCIYTISSQVNKLFVLSLSGDLLCEMTIGELPHPIKSLSLTRTGDILFHTAAHSKRVGTAGSAICILKPGKGLVERLHLKGLARTRVTDLCVTRGGVVVLSPEASSQLLLLRGVV